MKDNKLNIPIFPLNGAILFPGSNLPLNIFENRYLKMVDYAMQNDRKIGMIQEIENSKKLYNVGCVGKITSFSETQDNRYIINLNGLCRFKKVEEIATTKLFRILRIAQNDETVFNNNVNYDKELLFEKFKFFLQRQNQEVNFSGLDEIGLEELVKTMAMVCPFNVSEKQMLLESKSIFNLAENMTKLFDFYKEEYHQKSTLN